jgi:hypothetical protein
MFWDQLESTELVVLFTFHVHCVPAMSMLPGHQSVDPQSTLRKVHLATVFQLKNN